MSHFLTVIVPLKEAEPAVLQADDRPLESEPPQRRLLAVVVCFRDARRLVRIGHRIVVAVLQTELNDRHYYCVIAVLDENLVNLRAIADIRFVDAQQERQVATCIGEVDVWNLDRRLETVLEIPQARAVDVARCIGFDDRRSRRCRVRGGYRDGDGELIGTTRKSQVACEYRD
jgi:hypothetical protein